MAAENLGGCFDYVSVTPPYEAVVFADLMEQVGASPLIGPDTFMVSITYRSTPVSAFTDSNFHILSSISTITDYI